MTNFTSSIGTIETSSSFLSTSQQLQSDNSEDLKWSTYATIAYFSLNVLLIIVLSIYVHLSKDTDSIHDFGKAVWNRRGIYGQILVHLYDTATDIGVLVEWGRLAYDDIDYYSIDMRIMFFTSIGFLSFYRCMSVLLACYRASDDYEDAVVYLRDCCLALFDMYIIKTIYTTMKRSKEKVTDQQKFEQLLEAIFESLPQVCIYHTICITCKQQFLHKYDHMVALTIVA